MTQIKDGQLAVWWIPQIPMKSFKIFIDDLKQAKLLLDVLADYDTFQFENNVKPDYSNAGGLVVWEEALEPDENGEKWSDWYSEFGDTFDEYCEENEL